MTVQAVNDTTFQDNVREHGTTLVEFGATWCPPCKGLQPILDELANQYREQLSVLQIDSDESPEISSKYGVMSLPTVIVLHDGQPVEKIIGLRPKSVYDTMLARYV